MMLRKWIMNQLQKMSKAPECPCKDCERKGCGVYHDNCEKYQSWKLILKAYQEEVKNEASSNG